MTVTRICPICEAACGLKISTEGRQVIAIEPNSSDVFSRGHACAKGLSLKQLDEDTERLRQPLIKKQGVFQEATWEEALSLVQQELKRIRQAHSPQAIATYIGNPTAHNIGLSMGMGTFLGFLGSAQIYSAASVDQLPKQLACELMFGNDMAIPVPDIERCDYLLMLGANPAVSNGSLWLVPGFRDHLRQMQQRGGRLVTIDPRRSETARLADAHHGIKPGTDAWLLAALINVMLEAGAAIPSRYHVKNWDELKAALGAVDISEAASRTGIPESAIRQIAADLMQAEHAAVYGRIGTTLQQYGTLTSFLVEVLNLLSGSLDAEGGAMFPEQPFQSAPESPGGLKFNRYQSRVSGYPEVLGQMPLAALAEEIETPGEGQIRALVTFAGNPVVSGPDSDRFGAALDRLEFMVSVDIYLNETTQHADVILPGTSAFEEGHYDSFLGSMGYRNAARYSPPVFESEGHREWDIGLLMACLMESDDVPDDRTLQAFEDNLLAGMIAGYTSHPDSSLYGRDVQEILGMLPDRGVERALDLGIRAGRWGDRFGAEPAGLTLQKLIDTPDGIDLGSLRAGRLNDEIIRRQDGLMDLGPALILSELQQLVQEPVHEGFLLIGRRSPSTNNSWLHNLPMLTRGKPVCVLEIHPQDAMALGVTDGDKVQVRSTAGELTVTTRFMEGLARGVVSLPHGFSETAEVMPRQAKGPNYNSLAPGKSLDRPSGTAALNGIPVEVAAVH